MASPLERLALAVGSDPTLPDASAGPASAATGWSLNGAPRVPAHPADLELVAEAVYEGYLLHGGESRIFAAEDPDLALIVGDRLYALGLERLASAGDLASVATLADAIALSAQARATGDDRLADAVWQAAATELGWGSNAALDAAKDAARDGDTGAATALLTAAGDGRVSAARGPFQ